MVVTIMLVHHRVMLGKEKHVTTHRISKAFERCQVADVLMIGFDNRRDPMLAHQRLGALDALPTHAVGIEPFLPIRRFRTKSELRRILNHDLPPLRKQDFLLFRYAAIEFRSSRFDHYVESPDTSHYHGSTLPWTNCRLQQCKGISCNRLQSFDRLDTQQRR